MLHHNLEADVAENPSELVVYGGTGKAARNWECFDRIVETLENLEDNETLLVQSGKPVAVFRSHPDAPRVLIANSNLVGKWANWVQAPIIKIMTPADWKGVLKARKVPFINKYILKSPPR